MRLGKPAVGDYAWDVVLLSTIDFRPLGIKNTSNRKVEQLIHIR